jgi:hypothetical protein
LRCFSSCNHRQRTRIIDADKKRPLLLLDKRNAYAKDQDEAFKKLVRKQNQDKLDSDARIASNVPSAADRKLLEQRNAHCRAEYARTKALHARATKMFQAREAYGEDVRTIHASWEAFDRYGCFGALDDAFFDPRNG